MANKMRKMINKGRQAGLSKMGRYILSFSVCNADDWMDLRVHYRKAI